MDRMSRLLGHQVAFAAPRYRGGCGNIIANWLLQQMGCLGALRFNVTNDRAMWASRWRSGRDRVGGVPTVVDGVDTIDISGLGANFWSLNHTIFAANPITFGDMSRLIASGERSPDKCNAEEAISVGCRQRRLVRPHRRRLLLQIVGINACWRRSLRCGESACSLPRG
jgi:hypothetical protein